MNKTCKKQLENSPPFSFPTFTWNHYLLLIRAKRRRCIWLHGCVSLQRSCKRETLGSKCHRQWEFCQIMMEKRFSTAESLLSFAIDTAAAVACSDLFARQFRPPHCPLLSTAHVCFAVTLFSPKHLLHFQIFIIIHCVQMYTVYLIDVASLPERCLYLNYICQYKRNQKSTFTIPEGQWEAH